MTESPENQAPENGQAMDNGQGSDSANNAQTANWYDKFEGEDLGYLQTKGWNSEDGVEKMFESYKNLEKLKGAPADKLIKIPDGEDGWEEVYQKLGKPKTVDEYTFKPSEDMTLDEERVNWFGKTAHELNLTDAQHSKLVQAAYEYESQAMQAMEEKAEQERTIELNKLRDEWGSKYDERVELGKRAARAFVNDDDMIDQIEESMKSNAAVIKLFANIGESISEDKLPTDTGSQFGYTKEQAQNDLKQLREEIKSNPQRLAGYNDGTNKADREKVERLLKVIDG